MNSGVSGVTNKLPNCIACWTGLELNRLIGGQGSAGEHPERRIRPEVEARVSPAARLSLRPNRFDFGQKRKTPGGLGDWSPKEPPNE